MRLLKVFFALLILAGASIGSSEARSLRGAPVTPAIVNMGGGPNMLERSLFASNTPALPYSQWYVPGNGSPALSASDWFLTNGVYWSIPYDLDTMGAEGAAIKAREGGKRYVWLINADHIGQFSGSADVFVGYSSDPQIFPEPDTLRSLIPFNNVGISVVDQNGYTQNTFYPYQTPFLVYNPDDATNPFYIYMEGLSSGSARQHELTLIKSADLLTSTVIGPTIPTTTFTGWTSYGQPKRLGVNNWEVYAFGKPDGSFPSPTSYKYTSTDGWVWTSTFTPAASGFGPFINVAGQDSLLSGERGASDYLAYSPVNANKVVTGPGTRISTAFQSDLTEIAWQTVLQDVQAYVEDGVASIYITRGFPVSYHDRTNAGPYLGNSPSLYDIQGSITSGTLTVTTWPPGNPPLAPTFRIRQAGGKSAITAQLTGTGGATCPDPTCDGGVGTYSMSPSVSVGAGTLTVFTNGGLWQQMVDLYYLITDATAAASAAPLGVKASCAAGAATVQWNNSLPHQNYRVYYGSSAGSQPTLVGDVTGTSTTFTPPANQQTWIKVVTMNVTEQKDRVVNVYCSANTAMVNKHVNRFLNDGGNISNINIAFVATADAWLTSTDTYRYLNWWTDVRFGYKLNGSGFISKIYDLGTTLLPRGGDYTPTTSNTWPSTSSNTSYSATAFRGTTPSWVNNASSAHGYFGNGRWNNIQRWNEITLIAAYQKPGTATAGLFGYGEFDGMYLQHGAGSSGNINFAMSALIGGSNPYTVATVPFASATAPHVAAGVLDVNGTMTAYLDGVAGTPVPTAFANPNMVNGSVLRGSMITGSGSTGGGSAVLVSGSTNGSRKTSPPYAIGNEALWTGAGMMVLNKGVSQSIIQSWGALYN